MRAESRPATNAAVEQALASAAFRKMVEVIATDLSAVVERTDFGFSEIRQAHIGMTLQGCYEVIVSLEVRAKIIRPS